MEDNKKQVVEKENVEVVKTENVEKENSSTTNKFNKFLVKKHLLHINGINFLLNVMV